MREAFRPFAPAVTLREAPRWFDIPAGTEMPYMITTVDVRREYRNQLPAITHADGSAVLRASRLFQPIVIIGWSISRKLDSRGS